ncbi:alpha/beta fold hydrolase [Bailinhaonella thermotolerans]|uniref:Alpha/beta fold hydrolase n=1 Tax=Bailinhaonella thermotolerans TaxID=1070861 RepID=A0A3A4BA93_9ACTN|nr:alpha/beta hydrolase [Bailinhaonella thermotolerans]RJL35829.1 alpha/beta fold hydrolase [Bailinhaonella thermotolerans]
MLRKIKTSVAAALCCTALGAGAAGCDGDALENWDPLASPTRAAGAATGTPGTGAPAPGTGTPTPGIGTPETDAAPISGTRKIQVAGRSVNVSCSGDVPGKGGPVVVLLHGAGDGLDKLAAFQKTLSARHRVCSYDRLGAGASDKPAGPQDFAATGGILTGVLDRVAGDRPVVLAGHSLGGLIAARYAPDHTDRVKGLVLMDATPPTMMADVKKAIPESATGPAAELRAQNLAVFQGQNPELLVIPDGAVRPAGDIPVEVIQHGTKYLAAIPQHGPRLERAWAAGQREWLALSPAAKLTTAPGSGHHIYVDQPEVAVQAIDRVTARAVRQAPGE